MLFTSKYWYLLYSISVGTSIRMYLYHKVPVISILVVMNVMINMLVLGRDRWKKVLVLERNSINQS